MSATVKSSQPVQRFGSVTRLLPNHREEYVRLHADVWLDVRRVIREHGIVNHSIFYFDGLLFRYYEYVGVDHTADMRRMAEHPAIRRWAAATDPCQENVLAQREEKWSFAAEVCHLD